jgi:sarcosine oxidase subunit alpha
MMNAGLWKRPEQYGDPLLEVKAVRERVGLIDVSTLGKMKLTGAGVPDFLDKIYVNKWQKLGVGRVRYGLMCNAEGVVMDDGVTARIRDDEFYMSTTSGGAGSVFEWMQWWAQSGWGDEVTITDVTDNYAAFNLAGPESRAVLMALTDADVSNEAFPYMQWREMELAGVQCRLMRIGFTGELSYEIHCPSGYGLHVWEAIMAAGQAFGMLPFGIEAQRILRLEKAHIIVGQDTDALTDPVMLDMGGLVKMDKADFLGQRAIARISAEGVKQRLVGFEMVTPRIVPDEGLQIVKRGAFHQFNILGWVTSSRYSPTLDKTIGLCWLSAEVAEENGTKFTIRMNQDLLVAKVHHGAFYDVDGEKLRT